MIVYPCAKINLGLRVIEKRNDGFHNLETLFFPTSLTDVLEVVEAQETTLRTYGLETGCPMAENLCIKAYEVLRKEFSLPPVEVHLYKRIPVGAGLGGGSSDASFMIIALNKLFSLGLTTGRMAEIAAELGSDCPFFVYASELDVEGGEGIYGEGRGEKLSRLYVPQLRGLKMVLEFPAVFVSTTEAYKGVKPYKSKASLKDVLQQPVESWRNVLVNDFEKSVFEKYPLIKFCKEELYRKGALYASMSGSGSAIFGLFKGES